YLLLFGFRLNLYLDMRRDVLKEPNRDREFTKRLDVILHVNFALLDLKAFPFERLRNIGVRDRSIQRVLLTYLAPHGDLDFVQDLLQFLRIVLLLRIPPQQRLTLGINDLQIARRGNVAEFFWQ